MAQYMMSRQSKEREPKPAPGAIAPHRTLSLKSPTPELAISKSGDESVSSTSSSKASVNKWRKSPTTGKNVIVTDVDEFYAQQHAIHLENERKKREILHISDNKEVLPDKTSSLPPANYVKSMIPSFVDSAQDEDIILAIASSSNLTDDSNTGIEENGAFPRDLSAEFSTQPSQAAAAKEKDGELVIKEESDQFNVKFDGSTDRVCVEAEVVDERQREEQQDASEEKFSEAKVSLGETSVAVTDSNASSSNVEQASATKSLLVGDTIDDALENDPVKSTTEGKDGDSSHDAGGGVECDEDSSATGRSADVISSEEPVAREGLSNGLSGAEIGDKPSAGDNTCVLMEKSTVEEDAENAETTEKNTVVGIKEAVSEGSVLDSRETVVAEVHDPSSNELSTTGISGNSTTVEVVPADSSAQNDSPLDNLGSTDVIEPDAVNGTSVDMGSNEVTRNINDTSDLDDDFVVIHAEDAEGYNGGDAINDVAVSNSSDASEIVSRSIVDCKDSTADSEADQEEGTGLASAVLEPEDDLGTKSIENDAMSNILQSSVDDELDSKVETGPNNALDDVVVVSVSGAMEGHNESPDAELVDHVPDDVSNVSQGGDDDNSTATIDGDKPADAIEADTGIKVAAIESAVDCAKMEPSITCRIMSPTFHQIMMTRLPPSMEKLPLKLLRQILALKWELQRQH